MSRWSVVLLVIAVVGASPAWSDAGQPNEATLVERGLVVYREQKCQACHSIGGVGNRRAPLDGVGARLDAESLRKWIVTPKVMNPKVRKPTFDRLPKGDLDALVAYLRSLRTPKTALHRVWTDGVAALGGQSVKPSRSGNADDTQTGVAICQNARDECFV